MDFDRFCNSSTKELADNVLPFWLEYVNSAENEAFVGVVDGHGELDSSANLSAILFFRILWSFSASYRASGRSEYFQAAEKMYAFINRYFRDENTGFFYDQITAQHHIVDGPFLTITQAYAIYSLSEFCSIFSGEQQNDSSFREQEISESLFKLARRLELSVKTQPHGIFRATIDVTSESDCASGLVSEGVDVRCQLHLVEAFANLFRATGNGDICDLLTELLLAFEFHIFSKHPETMVLSFDENWQVTNSEVSFGHNMECAWLLYEASTLVANDPLKKCLSVRMVGLVNKTYAMAMKPCGALIAGVTASGAEDDRLVWWVQTETINALLACFELTEDDSYLCKAQNLWIFTQENFRDSVLGEWFTELNSLALVNYSVDKIGPWRGPYHITRMCLKLSEHAIEKTPSSKKTAISKKSKHTQQRKIDTSCLEQNFCFQ